MLKFYEIISAKLLRKAYSASFYYLLCYFVVSLFCFSYRLKKRIQAFIRHMLIKENVENYSDIGRKISPITISR